MGPPPYVNKFSVTSVFDEDPSTCQPLQEPLADNNQQEVVFDIPYYAHNDECRSDFYVNVDYIVRGQTNHDIINDIVQVSTSADDLSLDGSHWQPCQAYHSDIVDAFVSQRYRCHCEQQCIARVTVITTIVQRTTDIDMCEIKLYW